jgi:hypothetical protein
MNRLNRLISRCPSFLQQSNHQFDLEAGNRIFLAHIQHTSTPSVGYTDRERRSVDGG